MAAPVRLEWQRLYLGAYALITEEEARVVAHLSLCLDGWHTHIWSSTLADTAGLDTPTTRLDTDTAGLDRAEHHIFQSKEAATKHIEEQARSAISTRLVIEGKPV